MQKYATLCNANNNYHHMIEIVRLPLRRLIQPRNGATVRARQACLASALLAGLSRDAIQPIRECTLIIGNRGRRLCDKLALALILSKDIRRIRKPLHTEIVIHGLLHGWIVNGRGLRAPWIVFDLIE